MGRARPGACGCPLSSNTNCPVHRRLLQCVHSQCSGLWRKLLSIFLHGWRRHVCRACTGHLRTIELLARKKEPGKPSRKQPTTAESVPLLQAVGCLTTSSVACLFVLWVFNGQSMFGESILAGHSPPKRRASQHSNLATVHPKQLSHKHRRASASQQAFQGFAGG